MECKWSDCIERAKGNDQEAFYQLYQSSYDAVYRTVKSMIRDEDTAMDIVQDAFVKGFTNLSELDSPESFVPWMRRIAANKAKDWFKKKQEVAFSQLADEEDEEPDFVDERTENMPEEVIDRNETARLIDEILNGLSDEQRMAVGMFYYQNMSVAEIAAELDVSENTVKSRLHYGRKKIKSSVEALEKKGVKLYALSPVAFLVFLFRNQIAQAAAGTAGGAPEAAFGAIMAGANAAATGAAAASSAGATTGAAASSAGAATGAAASSAGAATGAAAASSAGAALGTAKAGFFASVGAKVAAAALAVAIAVGGTVGAVMHFRKTPAPVAEPALAVLPEAYEELKSVAVAEIADYRVAAAKKDGKWGVIDATGKVLVPFEYTYMSSPTASGHILATQEDADTQKRTYTVFDAQGNEILTTEKIVGIGTDVLVLYEKSYDDVDGGYLTLYHVEVRRISTGETILTEEYAKSVSCSGFEDSFTVLAASEVEMRNFPGSLTFYNSKGEILHREGGGGLHGGVDDVYAGSVWDGYYVHGYDYSSNSVYIARVDGSEDYVYAWDEGDSASYVFVDRVGPLLLLRRSADGEPSGVAKRYLLDIRTLPAGSAEAEKVMPYLLTQKGYDMISINALEKWFLVYDGERQGFLSRDGRTERLYDGAGDFVRSKAIVMDGDRICILDDTFAVLADLPNDGYTAVQTLGEGFYAVEKDGMWYPVVYNRAS